MDKKDSRKRSRSKSSKISSISKSNCIQKKKKNQDFTNFEEEEDLINNSKNSSLKKILPLGSKNNMIKSSVIAGKSKNNKNNKNNINYKNEIESENEDSDYQPSESENESEYQSQKFNSDFNKFNIKSVYCSKSSVNKISFAEPDSLASSYIKSNISALNFNSESKYNSRSKSRRKKLEKIDEELEELNSKVEYLPCRESEQNYIYNYIKNGLNTNGSYSGLYISGMPGTGKTACVTTVINKLKKEAKMRSVPAFTVYEINGMKITNLNNVYKCIYEFIFTDGRTTSAKKCVSILDNFFRNRTDFNYKTQLREYTNSHLVLIIDEIDCLINKKQMLIYNIFNWAHYPSSKLIIISISNTLDLPEKLIPKISSRMGNNRLTFKPYQKDELVKILSVKIENFDLFSEDAIKLSSMKVAAVSGDLRRILRICKRAKEIFDAEKENCIENNLFINDKIDKQHILKAIEDLYDAKVQKVIMDLQLYEKLTLAGILFEMKNLNNTKILVEKVFDRFNYFHVKALQTTSRITFDEFMMILYNLAKMHTISFSDTNSNNLVTSSVNIKFYPDEFTTAVNKDSKFQDILKDLS